MSEENENVIESLQMHEHPDRWGGWRWLWARPKPADSQTMERKLSYTSTFSGAPNIQGGGSEMELLSSQQEIICLIKDFPPSCSLGQSEVLRQSDQGTLGLQGLASVGFPASTQEQRKICLIP